MKDLRDNRDPELLGFALLGLAATHRAETQAPTKLSTVAEIRGDALAGVPDHGTPAAAAMRPSTNGHADRAVRAEPELHRDSAPCPACKVPRASNGRWLVCLNETCERYEEPI